jgi:hypothetical protein
MLVNSKERSGVDLIPTLSLLVAIAERNPSILQLRGGVEKGWGEGQKAIFELSGLLELIGSTYCSQMPWKEQLNLMQLLFSQF